MTMHPLFSEFLAKDHQDHLRSAADGRRLLHPVDATPPARTTRLAPLALVPIGALRASGRPAPRPGRGRRWRIRRPSTPRPGRLLGLAARIPRWSRPRTQRRTLGTVIFSDIVASTELVRTIGDRNWLGVIDEHDRRVDAVLDRFGGRRVRHTGDGVVALFDLPGQALRCAEAMHVALRPLHLEVRVGVHTGEIELVGDDIAGLTVHVAARIVGLAPAGQTWTSSTVRDLVVGDDVELGDCGVHALRGLGDWRLCRISRPVRALRRPEGGGRWSPATAGRPERAGQASEGLLPVPS